MKRTATVLYRTFLTLTWSKLWRLLKIALANPVLTLMGFYATIRTFSIAQKYFSITNSTDGIGNAFRHALWTSLILMYCCKVSSPRKSLDFCLKITDLYEELFPNHPLQTAMDLHNNRVGMSIFMEMLPGIHRQFFETGFITDKLFEKTKTALEVSTIEQITGHELIYLAG